MGFFNKEIRENLKKMSEQLIETCNALVEANKENTKALRELRRTLKKLEEKL